MPWPQFNELDQSPKPFVVEDTWTMPYFSCEYRKWVVSHLSFVMTKSRVAVVGVDLDVSDVDIDQCDPGPRHHPLSTATLVRKPFATANNSDRHLDGLDAQVHR